jgi:hypothetical protein
MNKFVVVLFGLSFLFWGNIPTVFGKSLVWEEFPLDKYGEKARINIKGVNRDYYGISRENPLPIKLKGPRKVLIHIRNSFPPMEEALLEYRVNVLMDERNFDEYAFRARPSTQAVLADNPENNRLGRLRKFVVEVPDGVHQFKFFPADSVNQRLFLRFFISEFIAKSEKRVSMSPDRYDKVVSLIYKEKEQTYFRMTPANPVEISVIGPTELKVMTRLEFNRRMKGKYSYQVQIFEDDLLIQTRQYRTYKSDVASYKKITNVSPGRSRSFLIPVPKGKHVYRFVPVTLQKESVIAKILIPQKDIGIMEE